MKKFLLFFLFLFLFCFSFFNRYTLVSLDTLKPSTKQVEIKGEVNKPGVYIVDYDATIQDVIDMAQGLTKLESTDHLNLNQVVLDQDVIVVLKKEDNKISINSASYEQLQTLPGIGPALANRIIEYRKEHSFQCLEDIKNIKGIGDVLFEKIKDKIVL